MAPGQRDSWWPRLRADPQRCGEPFGAKALSSVAPLMVSARLGVAATSTGGLRRIRGKKESSSDNPVISAAEGEKWTAAATWDGGGGGDHGNQGKEMGLNGTGGQEREEREERSKNSFSFFVAGSEAGDVRLWTLRRCEDEGCELVHQRPQVLAEELGGRVAHLQFDRAGHKLAAVVGSEIWLLRLMRDGWRIVGVDHAATLESIGEPAGVHFLSDDLLMSACKLGGAAVRIWSVGNGKKVSCAHEEAGFAKLFSHSVGHHAVTATAVSALEDDGNYLMAVGNSNGDVYLTEIVQNEKSDEIEMNKVGCLSLCHAMKIGWQEEEEPGSDAVSRRRETTPPPPRVSGRRQSSRRRRPVLQDEATTRENFSSHSVEAACEVLSLSFLLNWGEHDEADSDREGGGGDPPQSVHRRSRRRKILQSGSLADEVTRSPPWLLAGTSLGVAIVDVRTREVRSRFLFSEDEAFVSSVAVGWSEEGVECLARRIYPSERILRFRLLLLEEEARRDADGNLDADIPCSDLAEEEDRAGLLCVVARTPPSKSSFLNLRNHKSRPEKPPKSESSVGNYGVFGGKKKFLTFQKKSSFSSSSKAIKSSGYGAAEQRRALFQPQTNRERRKKKGGSNAGRAGNLAFIGRTNEEDGDDECRKSEESAPSESITGCGGGGGGGSNGTTRPRWATKKKQETDSLAAKTNEVKAQNYNYPSSSTALQIWPSEDGGRTRVKFSTSNNSSRFVLAACSSADHTVQIVPAPPTASKKGQPSSSIGYTLAGHLGQVRSLDFSHGGDLLATAGEDRIVKLWDWKTRKVTMEVEGKSGFGKKDPGGDIYGQKSTTSKEFFPDMIVKSQFYYMDQFVLTASSNKLFVHQLSSSLESGDPWHVLAKTFSISGCKFVTDFSAANRFYSHLVLCACSDRALRVLDVGAGRVALEATGLHRRPVSSVVQNLYGDDPAMCDLFLTSAGGAGGESKLWDLRQRPLRPVRRFDPPGSASPTAGGADFGGPGGGAHLALGSGDGAIYLYDLRRCAGHVARLPSDTKDGSSSSPVTDLSFDARGGTGVACGTQDGKVVFFS